MVEAALHMTLITFKVYFSILFVLGQRCFAVAHTVTFDIGFGTEVDAILVAELIPIGIVGIMAGAYSVDVHLFHLLDVL